MDKPCNDKVNNMTQYNNLSTDALRELLRLDFDAPAHLSLDVDTILYIAGLINNRENDNPRYRIKTTEEAYKIFRKYYMPK